MNHCSKQILVTFLIMLNINSTNSQTAIGVFGGYTANIIHGYAVNTIIAKLKAASGYTAGLNIKIRASTHINIHVTPSIITKNYSIVRKDVLLKNVYENVYNTYIQLPVTANYTYSSERLKGYIGAGFFTAYWLHKQQKGRLPDIFSTSDVIANNQLTESLTLVNFNKTYKFDNRKDNRIEFGYTATVGAEYLLNSILSICLNIQYFNTLTDQQKKYMVSQIARQNRTLCFCIGISFNLFK